MIVNYIIISLGLEDVFKNSVCFFVKFH